MAKKPFDPKAKQRRQKFIAIGGGVLLLGLVAIQGPRTWKMLNPPPPPPPAQAAPATPATPPAPSPQPGVPAPPPAQPVAPGDLPDSDPSPVPTAGQLISFGRFHSKDPFNQQLDPHRPSTGSGQGAANTPLSPNGTTLMPIRSTARSAPAPAARTASISVNGAAEDVKVGAKFPKADPVFRLVSLTANTAEISIVGGSYASGSKTATLRKGKPLTLMNTADGTRYELRLLSTS
jgi:hypothetical protein